MQRLNSFRHINNMRHYAEVCIRSHSDDCMTQDFKWKNSNLWQLILPIDAVIKRSAWDLTFQEYLKAIDET